MFRLLTGERRIGRCGGLEEGTAKNLIAVQNVNAGGWGGTRGHKHNQKWKKKAKAWSITMSSKV